VVVDKWTGFVYSHNDIDDRTTDTEENAMANPAYCGGRMSLVRG